MNVYFATQADIHLMTTTKRQETKKQKSGTGRRKNVRKP